MHPNFDLKFAYSIVELQYLFLSIPTSSFSFGVHFPIGGYISRVLAPYDRL